MCRAFLEGIFDVVYNDLYLGEENRTKTVMYAYDDAIHGVTGKAEDDKIYPVVHSEEKLKELIKGKQKITIYTNGRPEQAQAFAERVQKAAEEVVKQAPETTVPARVQIAPRSSYPSGDNRRCTKCRDIHSARNQQDNMHLYNDG